MGHPIQNDREDAAKIAQAIAAEPPLFGAIAATDRKLIGHNGGPPIADWEGTPASIHPVDPAADEAHDWAAARSSAYERFQADRNRIVYDTTPTDALASDAGLFPLPVDDEANPKDRMGALKLPTLSVIPSSLLLALGGVMRLGAAKYGRFNWRSKPVKATVYADAALRHLMSWMDGEETDPESGESHLGHVAACMGIVLDAKARGVLVDDRDVHLSTTGTAAEIIRSKALQPA